MRGCSSLNSSDLWLITKLQNYKSLWGIMQVGMPAPNDGFPFNMIAHEPKPLSITATASTKSDWCQIKAQTLLPQ
jgi:hypothetical protein